MAASLAIDAYAIVDAAGHTVRDTRPVFSQAASAANRSLAKDAATSTTLPLATGDGTLTYSISPALPAGLTLASARPTITGTPTAAGATTHTLTATDADGDRTTLGPFTVTVADGAPVVSAVTIVSTPYANATYGLGEVIQILVDFDKQVRRYWLGGQAELEVDMGGTIRRFQYSGGYSGNNLLFERVVSAADRDADGIGIGSDALTLGTGTLTDLETGVAAVTVIGTHAVANAAAHKVDGSVNTPLVVKSVSIVSSPASSDGYDVGESIKVEIAFSKRVSVTGAPRLALTIGSNTRQAAFERGTSDYALVFAWTVTANDRDSNGIGIAAGALTLNGGSIVEAGDRSAAAALGPRDPRHRRRLGAQGLYAGADHGRVDHLQPRRERHLRRGRDRHGGAVLVAAGRHQRRDAPGRVDHRVEHASGGAGPRGRCPRALVPLQLHGDGQRLGRRRHQRRRGRADPSGRIPHDGQRRRGSGPLARDPRHRRRLRPHGARLEAGSDRGGPALICWTQRSATRCRRPAATRR